MSKCEGGQHEHHATWWEYDARGIELCKVCFVCRREKLAQYRPEVLRDPNYEADEDIEPEPTVGRMPNGACPPMNTYD